MPGLSTTTTGSWASSGAASISARRSAWAKGVVGRGAIEEDPNFNGGDYYGGEAPDTGLAQARKLAGKPLSSLVETKRLMKLGQTAPVLERMAIEGDSFGRMLGEPAAREAFTAFMQKRKPDFSQC